MNKIDREIPSLPGVYLFKSKKRAVLYVGKAANLRARIRSYFAGGGVSYHPIKSKLLSEIADIETRPTESEIEALVLEAQLIKKLKPRFNILLRDSKNYIWVGFTREDYPRIIVTHQPTNYSLLTTHYVGPFTDAKALRRTLGLLRKIFPYYSKRKHLAIERQMGLVPPIGIAKEEYRQNVRAIKNILAGRKRALVGELKREIKNKARQGNYERAKILKDRLDYIQSVIDHAQVLGAKIGGLPLFADERPNFRLLGIAKEPSRIEGYDISNIHGNEAVGSMIVFEQKADGSYAPAKSEYRKFKIRSVRGANDPAMMKEVIERRLTHTEWPKPGLIVVDGGRAQLNAALQALSKWHIANRQSPSDKRRAISAVRIVALAKRLEEVYLPDRQTPIRADNFGESTKHLLQAIRDETHRFAISYHRLLRKKKLMR